MSTTHQTPALYLYKVSLNQNSVVSRMIAEPNGMHKALAETYCDSEGKLLPDHRLLFDHSFVYGGVPTMYVQCNHQLNWGKFDPNLLAPGTFPEMTEVKAKEDCFYVFSVRCYPSIKPNGEKNRRFIADESKQKAWFIAKMKAVGVEVNEEQLCLTYSQLKHQKKPQDKPVTLGVVTFTGEIHVKDAELFNREGLSKGIGPRKGLSYGMILIKKTRR